MRKRLHGVSPRSSRRLLCIAAVISLGIAFVGIRLVAPTTAPSPGAAKPVTTVADTAAAQDRLSSDESVPASSCGAPPTIELYLPSPVFAPRQLKATALKAFHEQQSNTHKEAGGNSVNVDATDLLRAERNVVAMLPEDDLVEPDGHLGGASCEHQLGRMLFNAVRNFLQESALDAMPIVLDYGCTMGASMSRVHANASVICLLDGQHRGQQRRDVTTLGQLRDASSPMWRRPKNLFWLTAPNGFHDAQFAQLYDACNFVTMAVMLGAIPPTAGVGSGVGRDAIVRLLLKTIPSTAVTIVALPLLPAVGAEGASASTSCSELLSDILHVLGEQAGVALACDVLGVVRRSAREAYGLLRLVLGKSRRPCRKTWGAPLVQWGRAQNVLFDNGSVTFRVEEVAAKGQQQSAAGGSKPTTMRTIHPLSYIHSLNLDTLLGAGLATPLRRQVLAQMVRSPRYSDPLPHNWVLSGGGRIERIDKIDLRYDRDVDESKGYWGHATRGYLHLLAHHLCLRVAPNGLPRVAEADATCRTHCRACARLCSYLPKGSTPCAECVACGDCIEQLSHASLLPLDEMEEAASRHCQKTYTSMHAARSAWKVWERADRKHPLDPA